MTLPNAVTGWWMAAALFAAAFLATLAAQAIDPRLIAGEGIWVKPAKFNLALGIHFATLALIAGRLGPDWRDGRLLAAVALASVVCAVLEVAYIGFQASRQLPSHFYVGTPLYAALYSAMAAGAVVITLAAGVVGGIAAVDRGAALEAPLRLAVVIGLVGGTVLTLITAFRMGGQLGHTVGVEPAGAPRMPLTGWSLTVGDLRPPHFLATHMMQALPLAGLVATRLLPGGAALVAVALLGIGWVALTLAVFAHALGGRPLPIWPPV